MYIYILLILFLSFKYYLLYLNDNYFLKNNRTISKKKFFYEKTPFFQKKDIFPKFLFFRKKTFFPKKFLVANFKLFCKKFTIFPKNYTFSEIFLRI